MTRDQQRRKMFAFFELSDAKNVTEGDSSLLFVFGEECNGIGMKTAVAFLNATQSNATIFGEATENKLSKGHKGTSALILKPGERKVIRDILRLALIQLNIWSKTQYSFRC